ncbi:uncharacterized protein KQ657_004999 [Scheffersomyces spartinae]|uniref:Uncharacterized protein n=1 Tax=Scheffersomyces spartinae TaxID=45513 RepID=A0A9P7VAG4_9ASCO|nr:uncharacterized protein KQ657_004999 [Scheffersomyces spartinae]KAG7194272.1 hypothetical protein KQ657_004999 [Scheffersomyces spartinae]
MVTTRSGKKLKFNEDGELSPSEDYHTADEVPSQSEALGEEQVSESESNSGSDSDSDSDDAPEEESTTGARKAVVLKQRAEAQRAQDLKNKEKEKRRQIDLRNKEQQELKRAKEQSQVQETQTLEQYHGQALPDYLPEDMFDSLHDEEVGQDHVTKPKTKGTHKKFSDDLKEMKRQLKMEKLKKLRMAKHETVRKGPVHVQVASFGGKSKTVPKLEVKILDTREKWLKRKSVNRK